MRFARRPTALLRLAAILLAPVAVASSAVGQQAPQDPPYRAPVHTDTGFPGLGTGRTQAAIAASLDLGPELQRGRTARWTLAEHRRLATALAGIQPQRRGTVDAYVLSIALDSDPVFGRETREAGAVLSRRFGAAGRTLVLAGSNGTAPSELPLGSIESFTLALARFAEVMDVNEDVFVLYVTSHGAPLGVVYHDGDEGFGVLTPARFAGLLGELGIRNRLLIVSACYSGVFVPALQGETTALFTAASSDRPSFGCMAENDWTFFGDAMINHALRKPQPLGAAFEEARGLISTWESGARLRPSNPQSSIGGGVPGWLTPLERQMPEAPTQPVGRPAIEALTPGG